jgi:hypothetical protein
VLAHWVDASKNLQAGGSGSRSPEVSLAAHEVGSGTAVFAPDPPPVWRVSQKAQFSDSLASSIRSTRSTSRQSGSSSSTQASISSSLIPRRVEFDGSLGLLAHDRPDTMRGVTIARPPRYWPFERGI